LVGVPVIVLLSLFNAEIVFLFLGDEFRDGYVIIPIISLGFLAWNFGMLAHKGLEFVEKTRMIFFSILFCVIINIILNVMFIPKFGYIAAAFATLISYLFYPVLTYNLAPFYLKWKIPWQSIRNIIISSLVVSSILLSLKYIIFKGLLRLNAFILLLILGLLIYSATLYFLKEIRVQFSWKKLFVTSIFKKRK